MKNAKHFNSLIDPEEIDSNYVDNINKQNNLIIIAVFGIVAMFCLGVLWFAALIDAI